MKNRIIYIFIIAIVLLIVLVVGMIYLNNKLIMKTEREETMYSQKLTVMIAKSDNPDGKKTVIAIFNKEDKCIDVREILETNETEILRLYEAMKDNDKGMYNPKIENGKLYYNNSLKNGLSKNEMLKVYENCEIELY